MNRPVDSMNDSCRFLVSLHILLDKPRIPIESHETTLGFLRASWNLTTFHLLIFYLRYGTYTTDLPRCCMPRKGSCALNTTLIFLQFCVSFWRDGGQVPFRAKCAGGHTLWGSPDLGAVMERGKEKIQNQVYQNDILLILNRFDAYYHLNYKRRFRLWLDIISLKLSTNDHQ